MLRVATIPCRRGRIACGLSLLALAAVLLAAPVRAAEMESLYTARVPLDPRAADARNTAYQAALGQILVRITGSEQAATSPELLELFPDPARYVLQFRPGDGDTLWVSLDGAAIEKIVRQTGYPVWGSDRPLTMLWLAVDWGQGERELITAADEGSGSADARAAVRAEALRARVRDVAERRGLPVRFPAPGSGELNEIGFADIWGGFHDRLVEVSRDGGAQAVLVGRLRPGVAERNRWSFYFGNQQRQWSGEPEQAMLMLADTLAGQLSIAGNAPLEAITLTVSGIDSVRAYGEVQHLIAGLPAVEAHAIESVAGDRIRFRIEISGGADRLGSALEFSGKLVPADAASMSRYVELEPATLHYVYDP